MSATAAPAGARGEPRAAVKPAAGVVGLLGALCDLGFQADWIGAYGHGASTQYFFHSMLAHHTTQCGIPEYQNKQE